MKQLFALILCCCILLGLTACSKPSPSDGGNSNADSAQQTGNSSIPDDQIITQKPLTCVSVPVKTASYTADDGTEIFRHVYQDMDLIVTDPEVAEKVIIDFYNRADGESTAEALHASAKAAYTPGSDWTPYLCQVAYSPMRIDQGILSMFGSYATYSGTPHPETSFQAVSYDLLTGDALTLDKVLTDSASSSSISQLVISALNAIKDEKHLFIGFEEIVSERFSKELKMDTDWYFSEDGLCFFFSPYEIASYASGVIVAQIPYQELAGIIHDAYMPVERDSVSGVITAKRYADADEDNYTSFAEVILASNADRFVLSTSTAVQCIRIESGLLSSDGAAFTPNHTVYAASDLTSAYAIVLEADLSNTNQTLRLSYLSNGQPVYTYITEDTVA